ncbi:MAG TPA: histidine kinase dimerization/phosphoacceptor domain -containing protein [Thermotogota bacterium]|nr:histidine kinase dimerization/phosphoacceptor domain -containing protein [Thermotogota bacterium]
MREVDRKKRARDGLQGLSARLRLAVFLCFVGLLVVSIFWLFFPMKRQLEKAALEQFSLVAQSRVKTLEWLVEGCLEGAASVSSRSMIRDQIEAYKNGEVSWEELVSYTSDKYSDGVNALENVLSASRLVEGKVLVQVGDVPTQVPFPDERSSGLSISFFESNGRHLLVAFSPVQKGETRLGWDVVVFDISRSLTSLGDRLGSFELLEASAAAEKLVASKNRLSAGQDGFLFVQDQDVEFLKPVKGLKHLARFSGPRTEVFASVNQLSTLYLTAFVGGFAVLVVFLYFFVLGSTRKIVQVEQSLSLKFNSIFENAPTPIVISSFPGGEVSDVNRAFIEMTGFAREDVVGRKVQEFNLVEWGSNQDPVSSGKKLRKLIETKGGFQNIELQLKTRHGKTLRGLLSCEVYRSGRDVFLVCLFTDISEIKNASERIEGLLQEKELLLREIHHRIKNNFNSVRGILEIQAENLKQRADEESSVGLEALEDASGRIRSMALLYDRLYSTPGFQEASVKQYLSELVDGIIQSFPRRSKVSVKKNLEEFVLGANTLSTLGILVNELVTNSVKHAFEGRESGTITVSAFRHGHRATVCVKDDGVGLPEDPEGRGNGFGLELVHILSRQLGGTLKIENDQGARFEVEFDIS